YTYDAGHPHQATNAHTDALDHDMNGNRIARGGDSYHYTPDDRLWYVEDSSRTVRFLYDYAGHRVVKSVTGSGASQTRYDGNLAEATSEYLTKYYYLAGTLVASQRVANAQLAALTPNPVIQLVGDPSGRSLLLRVALRPDAQVVALIVTAF